MAELNISQIEHIAKLSKLELTHEEKVSFAADLSKILSYVEQLSEVDTENVSPTANITGIFNSIAEDKILDSGVKHDDIKINAPRFDKDSIVVPGVFE